MADVPVPTITPAVPVADDEVLGVKDAALRLFKVHDIASVAGRVVSVKDPQFGAVGDGVTDDTAAWNLFLAYLAANGGTGWVPHGDYAIVTTPLQLLSAAKPFVIQGESARGSKLVRMTTAPDSILNWSGVNNFEIRDLGFDYNKDAFPSSNPAIAGHAIAISNASNVRLTRLWIEDWVNSAVLMFHFPALPPPVTAQEPNNIVEDCYLDGKGVANNGILFGDQYHSYMRGCTGVDIGTAGSPQYMFQFKNRCYRSHISDCIAVNARAGVAFGQEDVVGIASEHCSVSNITVLNTVWGVYAGQAAYANIDNINIVKDGTGSHVIELVDCVEVTLTNIKARGQPVGTGAYSVKFTGACLDNYVQFSSLNVNDTIPEIALFEAASFNNAVRVEKLKNTGIIGFTGQCALDNAPGVSGNSLEIAGYVTQELYEIASGVLTLKNPRVQIVRVNTEGAAAADDLVTINGTGRDGQTVMFKTITNTRDVTYKAAGGNQALAGTADFLADAVTDRIVMTYDVLAVKWCEVSRSNNA